MTLACYLSTPGWGQDQVPRFGCGIRSQPSCHPDHPFFPCLGPLINALAGVERQIMDQRHQVTRRKYESETMVLGPRCVVELYLTVVR
jgi:hypothetical protein